MSNPTLSTQEAVGRWREKLAELEHDQWIKWSKDLAIKEILTQDRLKRWLKLWQTPYSKLTEKEKDQDRVWADKVLKILVKELSAAVRGEREWIMDLSYEATADKDWTVDNHIKLCGMLNSTQKGKLND